MDLVPGQQTNLWFTPTILGTYEVACAEYCGTGHFAMRGLITVDTMNDFQSWLAEQPTFFDTMNEGTQGQGKQIVQTLGCVACHSDNGNNGIGPTWKNSFGSQRVLTNGETIIVDAEYIKESIVNPNAKTAQGYGPVMPAYKMSDDELDECSSMIGHYKKISYTQVRDSINHLYYDTSEYYSSAMDILASYVRGQKLIYMESQNHRTSQLDYLMLPAIFLSALASVLQPALSDKENGDIILASISAFVAFILAIINYLKLAKTNYLFSNYQFSWLCPIN